MGLRKAEIQVVLREDECQSCGVVFAIPKIMHDNCKTHGGYWSCPNGHRWGYRKGDEQSKAERLQTQLKKAQRLCDRNLERANRMMRERDEMSGLAVTERRRANGYKGQMVLAKKRTAAGKCPCCERTYKQLARHIARQHPDYINKEEK